MHHRQHKIRGFTLIELGIVLGALAILSGTVIVGSGFRKATVFPKAIETLETIHAAITHMQVRQAGRRPAKINNQQQGLSELRQRALLPGTGGEELRISSDFVVKGIQMTVSDEDFYKVLIEGDPTLIAEVRQWYADDPRFITTNSTHPGCVGSQFTDSPYVSDPFCFVYATSQQSRIRKPTGGGSGPCTLCGELFKQNMLSEHILRGDLAHSAQYRGTPVQLGYWFLAKPVATLMQHSALVSQIAAPFIRSWAEHMAHLEGAREKDNRFGDLLQHIGVPITHTVGKLLLALDTDAGFDFKLWKIRTQHLSNQELLEIAIVKEKNARMQRQASTP